MSSISEEATSLLSGRMQEFQAIREAFRCLQCYDAPCIQECPVAINIPKFIFRLSTRDFIGAAKVIQAKNPLGAVCGQVCPTEELCQKGCSSSKIDRPIDIGGLQEFVIRRSLTASKGVSSLPKAVGKKVAVIGGGPSGLAAATELCRQGFQVTLFEKEKELGGIPRYEIPDFRLDRELLEKEIQAILLPGLEIKKDCMVDESLAENILAEYDAVYLAGGLGKPRELFEEKAKGSCLAEDFLREANEGLLNEEIAGKNVAVIGGGNTAMDAAIYAKKLGAERVSLIYRRSLQEMPAWRREYLCAVEAGVEFCWLTQPLDLAIVDGKVQGLICCPVGLGEPDETGRRQPLPEQSNRWTLAVDVVISALGRVPNRQLPQAFGLALQADGTLLLSDGCSTSNPKVFAGGDLANGGKTVVQAVAEGRKAAEKITTYLTKA